MNSIQFLVFLIVLFLFWHYISLLFVSYPLTTVLLLIVAGLYALVEQK